MKQPSGHVRKSRACAEICVALLPVVSSFPSCARHRAKCLDTCPVCIETSDGETQWGTDLAFFGLLVVHSPDDQGRDSARCDQSRLRPGRHDCTTNHLTSATTQVNTVLTH